MEPVPIPCLVGPTGSGKSEVAIHAARRDRGEIVCCDAYTVYRGMPILTAAPRAPADVPHHLVGVFEPEAAYDAARFLADCDAAVDAIRASGRVPWIVGGTALYLRGWLKGFGPAVPRDAAYRAGLRAQAESEGPEVLHALLRERDPARAADLHPNDVRRVVRALEILRATGRPASALRSQWDGPDRVAARLIGLRRSPEDLDDRIARRTEAMFAAGVVAEARALLARPLSPEAGKALGLEELRRLLGGEMDEASARASIERRTRRFARKQMTFFRSFSGLGWIDVAPGESAEAVATRL